MRELELRIGYARVAVLHLRVAGRARGAAGQQRSQPLRQLASMPPATDMIYSANFGGGGGGVNSRNFPQIDFREVN